MRGRGYKILVLGLLFIVGSVGCGAVGPPIPRDELGVAKLLEQQARQETRDESGKKDEEAQPETMEEPERGFQMPPLRPIGGE